MIGITSNGLSPSVVKEEGIQKLELIEGHLIKCMSDLLCYFKGFRQQVSAIDPVQLQKIEAMKESQRIALEKEMQEKTQADEKQKLDLIKQKEYYDSCYYKRKQA